MKKVLKNILQPLIGILLLVLYSIWIINNYHQYSNEMMIACTVLSIAVIISRFGDLVIEHYIKKTTIKLWIVKFAVATIVYLLNFIIISYIANMTATASLILCISVGYAVIHIMFGAIIEKMTSDSPSLLPVFAKNNL